MASILRSKIRRQRLVLRFRWLPIPFLVIAVVYTGGRLRWSDEHLHPGFRLDANLTMPFDYEQYGLTRADRVVSVNGTPVSSMKEFHRLFDEGERGRSDLVFGRVEDGQEILTRLRWVRSPGPFAFEMTLDDAGVGQVSSTPVTLSLSEEEEVTHINGKSVKKHSFLSGSATNRTGDLSNVSTVVRFTVSSGPARSGRREIVVDNYTSRKYWGRYFAGILVGLVGVVSFWIKPDTRSSIGFASFCGYVSLFWMARSIPFAYRLGAEDAVYHVLQCFLPVPAVLFLLTFTPLRVPVRRTGRWLLVTGAGCAGLVLLNWIFFPDLTRHGILGYGLFLLWGGALLALVLLSLPLDWWLTFSGKPLLATDRQRSQLLRIALLLGFFPAAAYTAIPFGDSDGRYTIPIEMTLVFFPILISYGIVRHNLLQIGELAREGLLYGLLISSLTALYVGATSVVIPLLAALAPGAEDWVRPVILAGVLLVATPLHGYARTLANRHFKRLPFEYDAFLDSMEEAELGSATLDGYCIAAAANLGALARVEHVAVLLRHSDHDGWRVSAQRGLPFQGPLPNSCETLVSLLEEEECEIVRDEIIESIRYEFLRDEVLEGLDTLKAAMLFPLAVRGRLVGALSMGEKSSRSNFSGQELKVLRHISARMAKTVLSRMGHAMPRHGKRIVDLYPNFPERIGGFEIERVLGEGGMSYVFLGSENSHRHAIKVANHRVQANAGLMERFSREAMAIDRVRHPNIVRVYETGWEGPEPFIVLEYFSGGSMEDQLKEHGPYPERDVLEMARDITLGLEAAHGEGIIHRDIKPNNLFRVPGGVVKIGDFGLAHLSDQSTITAVGDVFGTPDYMCPEVIEGAKATIQSDQYSLGVTLYELLSGVRPFQGENIQAILYQRIIKQAPDLSSHGVSVNKRTQRLLRRLMSKDKDGRFSTYSLLLREVEGCLSVI